MAPVGVQFVKDVLRLVKGAGWPARGSWRFDLFTFDAVMRAGDGGLRLALALAGHRSD